MFLLLLGIAIEPQLEQNPCRVSKDTSGGQTC
jgi:hypothetical protein